MKSKPLSLDDFCHQDSGYKRRYVMAVQPPVRLFVTIDFVTTNVRYLVDNMGTGESRYFFHLQDAIDEFNWLLSED